MPYQYQVVLERGIVRVAIEGAGPVEQFIAAIRSIGAESVRWASQFLLVDLRGVDTEFPFTDQLLIGQAVGVNLRHLHRHAAVVRPERITRVGEKAAQHEGATVRVFAEEEAARRWLLGADQG